MNLILAEISDKMPTIVELWLFSAVLSIPVLLGIVHKWISWVLLAAASIFSACLAYGAYYTAFLEPGFADAVQSEMGRWWITNWVASAFLPAAVAVTILYWHITKKRSLRS